ncbi:MAG: hypothetical protein ACWGNI_00300 [Desulfobacterales bacterium]
MDEEFTQESAKLAKIAVEKCILTENMRYVTVLSDNEKFRVKATKRLLKEDKQFYGEILVVIGPPTWKEQKRIDNMKKHGKLPKFFITYLRKTKPKEQRDFW